MYIELHDPQLACDFTKRYSKMRALCFLPVMALLTAASYTPYPCANLTTLPPSLDNATLSSLPSTFAPAARPQEPIALDQIRATLALYPLVIDSKSFASLSLIFTPGAVANYSAPLGVLTPLSTIESVLEASLAAVTTQHLLGTQVIELLGECAARSVTYYRAAHFGMGVYEGQVVEAFGQYRDVLVKWEGGWRVRERGLVYMVSNRSLLWLVDGALTWECRDRS